MKKIILALTVILSVNFLFAQDTTIEKRTLVAPAPTTITLDTQVVGGQQFFVIADDLNGLYSNIRVIAVPIIDNPPQRANDWVLLIIKLISSGVLASIVAQGVKIYKDAKALFSGMANEWIVLIVSGMIGAGWMYFENSGFQNFDFMQLFGNTAKVFALSIVAWRLGLSRLFAKKETTPTV